MGLFWTVLGALDLVKSHEVHISYFDVSHWHLYWIQTGSPRVLLVDNKLLFDPRSGKRAAIA